jgi:hypothetical protein
MKNIVKDSRVEFRIGKIKFKGNTRIAEGREVLDVGQHAL